MPSADQEALQQPTIPAVVGPRRRGRRAAAATDELVSEAAFETTEPELTPAGVAEPVTAVAAVDVTAVVSSPEASGSPDSIIAPMNAEEHEVSTPQSVAPISLSDVLGEIASPPKGRAPGRRAVSQSSDDAGSSPRNRVGRRGSVAAPKLAKDSSKNVASEIAVTRRRGRRSSKRMIAQKSFAVFAFLVAGGIAVATSLPAEAYFAATPDAPIAQSVQVQAEQAAIPPAEKQQVTTDALGAVPAAARDGYTVLEVPKVSMAGFNTANTFANDTSGTIQWPFPTGVPISDGFGGRASPGGIGSTNHQGIDFNPGMGAPIQVVADGTVRLAQKSDAGGYGCHVIVDHNVNGMKFASLYGHMQCASIEMSKGDVVKVGDQVGKVGSTGTSTGAHLHFEIHNASDTPIDPMPWLTQYAN